MSKNLKVVDYKIIADRLLVIAHAAILDNKTEVEIADLIYQLRADVIHTNYINPVVREHYLKNQEEKS